MVGAIKVNTVAALTNTQIAFTLIWGVLHFIWGGKYGSKNGYLGVLFYVLLGFFCTRTFLILDRHENVQKCFCTYFWVILKLGAIF